MYVDARWIDLNIGRMLPVFRLMEDCCGIKCSFHIFFNLMIVPMEGGVQLIMVCIGLEFKIDAVVIIHHLCHTQLAD